MKTQRPIRWTKDRLVREDPRNNPALWLPHGYFWEKGVFTVPASVSEERVQSDAARYRNRLGGALEMKGLIVLGIEGPTADTGLVGTETTDPDRRRYVLWARVKRGSPITQRFSVPDSDVAIYQAAGAKLID